MPPSSGYFIEDEIKTVLGEGDLDALALVVVTDDPVRPLLPLRSAAARTRRFQTGGAGIFIGHTVADVLLAQPCVEQDEVLVVDIHCGHILLSIEYMHRVETSALFPDCDAVMRETGGISPKELLFHPLGERIRSPGRFPQRVTSPGGA